MGIKYLIKVIAEHACFKYDYVTVPLYDTLGEDAIEHIVNLCEIPLIVCTKDKAEILFKLKDKLKKLTNIVLMDETASSVPSSWGKSGLVVSDMIELELQGSKKIQKRVPTTKDSIATVCFTSGTTGLPKGAMLSHGNLLSFLAGALQMIENKNLYNITSEDSYISYLPLAHIMERALQVSN
jgi:long-chain acyl-CoA synthetase